MQGNPQTVKPRARYFVESRNWHVRGDGRAVIGPTLDAALQRWLKCGLQLMGCERQTIMAGIPRETAN